jgi:hypothetical protein
MEVAGALRSPRQVRLIRDPGVPREVVWARSSERAWAAERKRERGGLRPDSRAGRLGEEEGQESIGLASPPNGGVPGTDARSEQRSEADGSTPASVRFRTT